jgi:hypothetical protein
MIKKPTRTKTETHLNKAQEDFLNTGSPEAEKITGKKSRGRPKNKVKRCLVNIGIPEPLLEDIDSYLLDNCPETARTTFLLDAIRQHLAREKAKSNRDVI